MSVFVEQNLSNFISADESEINFHVTQTIRSEIMDEIKKNLKSNLWDEELPDDWHKDINVHVNGQTISIETKNAAIKAHEEGVDPHPQTYLAGETIPIKTDTNGQNRMILRKCTPASLAEGKFWHPGMEGKGFIEDAVDTAMKKVGKIIDAVHLADEFKANSLSRGNS